jgi:hypothetical protein
LSHLQYVGVPLIALSLRVSMFTKSLLSSLLIARFWCKKLPDITATHAENTNMVLNRTTAKFDIVRRRVKNRNRYNLDIQLMYTSFITGTWR